MFELISIELEGFLGYTRPRIKNFKANFSHNKLQVLNSGNGDGKSTTISELNPFPIQKELFDTGGYKKLLFKYEGKEYLSESNHKRNFLYDIETGENLNDGGTQTQQVALIQQMFNITPLVWNICMGAVNFTDSDKNTRRKWIETISGVDFDYGFNIYKLITQELNSTKGANKHLTQQLSTEASKLLSVEEITELEAIRVELTEWVREALLDRDSSVDISTGNALANEIKELELASKSAMKAYNDLGRFINPFSNLSTIDSLKEHYNELQSDIRLNKQDTESKIKDLEERSELLRRLDSSKGIDIDEVNKELESINKSIIANEENFKLAPLYSAIISRIDSPNTIKGLYSGFMELNDKLLTNLVTTSIQDDDLIYPLDKDTYDELTRTYNTLTDKVNTLTNSNKHLENTLKDLDEMDSADCPECGTHFKLGEEAKKNTIKNIDRNTQQIEEFSKEIERFVGSLDKYDAVEKTRSDILNKVLGCFSYRYLEDLIVDEFSNITNLTMLETTISDIYHLVKAQKDAMEFEARKVELNNIIKEYNAVNGVVDGKELGGVVTKLEEEINSLRSRRKLLEDEVTLVVETGKIHNKHLEVLTRLQGSLELLIKRRGEYARVLENTALEYVGRDLQARLAEVNKKVVDNEILVNLISKLEEMLQETKDKIEDLKVLEQALNPATGLIAEQLVGYVSAFSKQLTGIIGKLWGYPMVIKPCGLEGRKGMDYLFPFNVGGKDIPDVAKGSKSQLSVINLAVMLCTRISLKLNHLPLFLDEVGAGFSTAHNEKLAEFIRELLLNYDCSNVFLVHHDISVRNSLGPRDTIVFDPTQVIVEPGYNTHVEIEHYKD